MLRTSSRWPETLLTTEISAVEATPNINKENQLSETNLTAVLTLGESTINLPFQLE
jgi:hypothetical protein